MDTNLKALAQKCLDGAYNNTMSFPEILKELMQKGFESYHVDYMRGTATYYLIDGNSVELSTPQHAGHISKEFNDVLLQLAIKEAQQNVVGYTYKGFCQKAMAAGCAGYFVSLLGKRVLYFGRTAEVHVEHFP